MMVAVGALELLGGHSKEARCLPKIRSRLHLPRRGSVAEGMRGHIGHAAITRVSTESLVDIAHRVAVPFDAKALSTAFPAPQMR